MSLPSLILLEQGKMVSDTVIFYMTCRQSYGSFIARRCSVSCIFPVSVSAVSILWSSIWLISAWTIQTENWTIQQSRQSELFILKNFNLNSWKGLWKATEKINLLSKFNSPHNIYTTNGQILFSTGTHPKPKVKNCCSHSQMLFFTVHSSA